jgi:uncharacterized protein (DUF1778 family)
MSTVHNGESLTRFDFRIEASKKKAIQRAADILGMSLTQFAKTALLDRAQEIVQNHGATVLSDRDRDVFLRLLDQDATPSPSLVKAAARYKKLRNAAS